MLRVYDINLLISDILSKTCPLIKLIGSCDLEIRCATIRYESLCEWILELAHSVSVMENRAEKMAFKMCLVFCVFRQES